MPPSGFNQRSTKGLLDFVAGCYEDLLEEVRSGKHETYEAAIEHELTKIDEAVSKLEIAPDGILTQR